MTEIFGCVKEYLLTHIYLGYMAFERWSIWKIKEKTHANLMALAQ
jgi:hypothetical protein